MEDDSSDTNMILTYTGAIVAAYVRNNTIPASELSAFIRSVYEILSRLPPSANAKVQTNSKPAVPINKSITPDYLVCLEDGKHLKMLKRYLRSRYGMSPDDYRAKWNLPIGYPMVAPNYSARRSELAKKNGLGQTRLSAKIIHKPQKSKIKNRTATV
jgi:predicted transcriptional regulator